MPPPVPVLASSLEALGAKVTSWALVVLGIGRFAADATRAALHPATWNPATLDVVVKQIYFTAVQILPVFVAYCAAIGAVIIAIIVATARDFGLTGFAVEITLRFLALELMPFLTVIFVALRSGAAINTEIALMRVNREFDALAHCRVNPMQFELLPRLIGGMVSVAALAWIANVLVVVMTYLFVHGAHAGGLESFSAILAKVYSPAVVIGLGIKCTAFGLFVTLIPVTAGLETPMKLFMAPVSVLRGMMRVFFAIMVVQLLSLAIKYI
jgi:phospholipid/cholesterol/gamma-HCH transport system permease protein